MFRSCVLALTILAVASQPLCAACLDQAVPELGRGTTLTILRTDNSVTTVKFIRAEQDPLRLVLEERLEHSQRAPREFELPVSEVLRLDAPPKVRFHGKRVGIGAFAGFGVGSLIGTVLPISSSHPVPLDVRGGPPPGARRINSILIGGFAAAILGTFVGFLGATAGGTPRSWSCLESGDEIAPAASDSTQSRIR